MFCVFLWGYTEGIGVFFYFLFLILVYGFFIVRKVYLDEFEVGVGVGLAVYGLELDGYYVGVGY